ncbi:glycosyltransferase family 2 protein [Luteococcus sp. OSA5]|uniref:glycosyltransferase family 2 protein n=1 Tax=Luteococcus sp. OSA5 TaxID=3401630 RepID=UPI003B43A571
MLSVVVPCYQEAANLPRLHEALVEMSAQLDAAEIEVILVNDGSLDNTFEVAWKIAQDDPRVRVLSFSRNFGKEAAMLAGLREARGEAVVILDADLQHPPELIPRMLQTLQATGAGQVVAKRDRRGDPVLRSLLSRIYYRLVNSMIDVRLEDGVGDFRMLSRRAVDALLELAERNRFSKGLFAWIGFRTETIEYRNVGRGAGASSWSLGSLVNYGIDGVISFNDRPLRLLAGLGGFTALGGLLYLLWLILNWWRAGVDTPGYITTIAVMTILGGIQLLSVALVGEYVGRIYAEVKARPHYIVEHDSARESERGPQ